MSKTENGSGQAAARRRKRLWRHVLLLLFASALFGNLYALFSLRENWLAVAEKTIDIQNNINIISDRIYDMDARLSAAQLKLSEVTGELQPGTLVVVRGNERIPPSLPGQPPSQVAWSESSR